MTATITPAATTVRSSSTPTLWRHGLTAGVVAAGATTVVAAAAHALGVSLETAPGEAIPVAGFAQLTLVFTAVGVLIARAIGRRARRPSATFVKTTVVLTALSLLPDVAIDGDVATKLTLMLTHLVAAAIVIPALSRRLAESTSD